jgi:DNA-binding transcriptional LysR family regulator
MPHPLDLHCVRVFREVARQRGFVKAGETIHLSQPAVTKAVRRLEDQVGMKLFERAGRGRRLTAAGEALRDLTSPLLADWEQLPARLAERLRQEVRGPVRVGTGEGGALYLLPEPIRQLRTRYPEVEVIVRNQPASETLAMLRAGELDFGLRALSQPPQGLDYRPCLPFDRVLLAPLGHALLRAQRLTLTMLAAHPFVMTWPQANTRRLVESRFAAKGLSCRVVLEAGGWEVIKRYVALGAGIAVVPACCVTKRDRREIGARSARSLFGQDIYGILLRRDHVLPVAADKLVHLIETTPGAPKSRVPTLRTAQDRKPQDPLHTPPGRTSSAARR